MKLFFCILSLMLLISCSKDKITGGSNTTSNVANSYETFKSDNWLMAYPNSYWVYDDGFSDTVSEYFFDSSCVSRFAEDIGNIVRYRSSKLYGTYTHADYCYRKHFTFAAVGDSSYQASNTFGTLMTCVSIDTSMVISGVYYDSVQVVKEFEVDHTGPLTISIQEINYYQYGVGCIKTEHFNTYTNQLVWERELVNHYIAPH